MERNPPQGNWTKETINFNGESDLTPPPPHENFQEVFPPQPPPYQQWHEHPGSGETNHYPNLGQQVRFQGFQDQFETSPYSNTTTQPSAPNQSFFGISSNPDSEEKEKGVSKKKSKKASSSPPKVVESLTELSELGTFLSLRGTDPMFRTIEKYVTNSCDLENNSVKIHMIAKRSSWFDFSRFDLLFTKRKYEMLLWCKTTPRSVHHLVQRKDGCIAFFDRIARAFPTKPEELTESCRQIILLCSVNLGAVHKDNDGYSHWSKETKNFPNGFNSVKGQGRRTPIWIENEKLGSVIVPSGKTKEAEKDAQHELEYNEYMVREMSRVKIKFVVDLEVFPESE